MKHENTEPHKHIEDRQMTTLNLLIITAANEAKFESVLPKERYHIAQTQTEAQALNTFDLPAIDLLIINDDPPHLNSLELLPRLRDGTYAGPPIILLVRLDRQYTAVMALKLGAQAYLVKDPQQHYLDQLPALIDLTCQQWRTYRHLQAENAHLLEVVQHGLAEREQTEKTMQGAYQRLTLYIENSPLIIVEWDKDYRVTHWSQEAEEFFGWQVDEVLGKHPSEWQFVHEDDAPQAFKLINNLMVQTEAGNVGLYRNYTKSGNIVHCEWYNSIIYDEHERLVSVLSLVLDVTERRQAVSSLRESEQRFRQVITSISDHIYMGEIAADGRMVITRYTSPNVVQLLGYPAEQFTNWTFWQTLIYPDDLPIARSQFEESGRNIEVEYRMQRADGTLIWVRDSRRLEIEWDAAKKIETRFVYGVVHDITERKEAEFTLQQERASLAQRVEARTAELRAANAALAQAARLKDEFLANMSHELRTPLNAILGKSETLQEGIYGELNEKQLRSLRTIEESGRHLLTLINEILDISKIEAGKLELDIHPVSVQWICEASLRLINEMALKKGVKMLSTLDPAVTSIIADGRRLKQILVNLLGNAVKFTPSGGQIGLEVMGDTANEVVHFTVWDTGIGIEAKDMAYLFQPFVQLDSSLSRQYEGTGLGLSLVHRMTDLHGGGVSVQSKPDQGSRFTVSLPWPQKTMAAGEASEATRTTTETAPINQPSPRQSQPQPMHRAKHQPHILVVEDNENNIDTLLEYLPHKGYQVSAVRDGAEAVAFVRTDRPDMILMDIQTPGMNGLEATRYIRQHLSLTTLPIVAITGLAMPGDKERCLEAGADDYLSKPISLKNLIKVIETYLGVSARGTDHGL
jgi:PAS domain S-box-containing protein